MNDNYFFFDGSALLADVKRLHADPWFAGKLLQVRLLVQWFASGNFSHFHQNIFRRAVFYFVEGDPRVDSLIERPDSCRPGEVADLRVEFCGRRVKQTEQATRWLQENSAPQYVLDSLYRAEKAVDTQICCDALQLAGQGKLDRLFLYTNDSDFVPLFRSLRQLGANANLIRLTADNVNKELANESDGLCVLEEYQLNRCFGLGDRPPPTPVVEAGDANAETPK